MSFGGDDQDLGRQVEQMYRELGDRALLQEEKAKQIRARKAERAANSAGRVVGILIGILLYLAACLALVAITVALCHEGVRFIEFVWRLT